MTPEEAWEIAHRRLVDGFAVDAPAVARFVLDDEVDYDQPRAVTVRRSTLFGLAADRWRSILEPPPTWIHFNLLGVDDGRSIVSVRRSSATMTSDNPTAPAVNVSAEYNPANFIGHGSGDDADA